MFSIIARSSLQAANLRRPSCQPSLLPKVGLWSWSSTLGFLAQCPQFLPDLSTLPSKRFFGDTPTLKPFLDLPFTSLLLGKPSPLFLLWSSPVGMAVFSAPCISQG